MIIYKCVNKVNGKVYVGKSSVSLNKRICQHVCRSKSGGQYLHAAIRKYGIQLFEWSIIDTAESLEILNEKECYWIKMFNCVTPNGYNGTCGGDTFPPWNGVVTAEHREKSRVAHIGKHHSVETREKMRVAISVGRKGLKLSDAVRKKRNEKMGALSEDQVRFIRANRFPDGEALSGSELARRFGISGGHVSGIIHNLRRV